MPWPPVRRKMWVNWRVMVNAVCKDGQSAKDKTNRMVVGSNPGAGNIITMASIKDCFLIILN